MPTTQVLPYTYSTHSYKRVLIKPIPKEQVITAEGLIIPTDIQRLCEYGIAHSVSEGSTIKPGDALMYKKLDRSMEQFDTVVIDDIAYDVVYEMEIWAINSIACNRIFVKPVSALEVSETGLLIPESAKGVTQKGIVFSSGLPVFKEGDLIEYRKQEQNIYPTISIDNNVYDILNETDVFILNGYVAPCRILVKIDLAAQRAKRLGSETGLLKAQNFLFMKHNLQYAEVVEIGDEAKNNYPDMKVGDTAIIFHTVEDVTQNYRVIKYDIGTYNIPSYEYRIINAFDTSSREVLGRIVNREKMIIHPYGKSVFLEWDFDLLFRIEDSKEIFVDFENNLDKCHDLEDLVNTIKIQKKSYVEKAAAKVRGYTKLLPDVDPAKEKEKFHRYESQLNEAKRDALKVARYVNNNHLLMCVRVDNGERVVVPYRELYPIEILGHKFIVAWSDYILASISGSEY